LRVGGYPANGYPLVELGSRTKGDTMRPRTEAETRLLRARLRKKVSVEEIAKTLGRHVGSVKKKGQRIRLDPNKERKGENEMRYR
jgi:DNA-directed RNA polymerase specialized sigma24 family protein